jgi:hypothetical protein
MIVSRRTCTVELVSNKNVSREDFAITGRPASLDLVHLCLLFNPCRV